MAEREVEKWITVNGSRVPIFKGESQGDAVNRAIAQKNEDIKNKQIADRKKESDALNANKLSTTDLKHRVKQLLIDKKGKLTGYDFNDLKKLGYNGTQIQNAFNYYQFSSQQEKFRKSLGMSEPPKK